MSDPPKVFETEKLTEGIALVTITRTHLLDESGAWELKQELENLFEADVPFVLIDFASVSFLSSVYLGVLDTFHKKMAPAKRTWALCNVHPAIGEIFDITRLRLVWDVERAKDVVLASWQTPA